jgi:hypothetical protein
MKYALLLGSIIEFLGAYVMYFHPDLVFFEPHLLLSRFYGLAALVLSFISFIAYKLYQEEKVIRTIYLIIMFFHGAIALVAYQDMSGQLIHRNETIVSHVIIFGIFVGAYLKDLKPDK